MIIENDNHNNFIKDKVLSWPRVNEQVNLPRKCLFKRIFEPPSKLLTLTPPVLKCPFKRHARINPSSP